jgi:fructose-bisphosphate aldolase class I
MTRRLHALKIDSTPESRRVYREMFCTTSGIAEFISGVILQDETIYQRSSSEIPLVDVLAHQGILPGIKVDHGAKPLAGCPGETITEGLDGLRDRLREYREIGARFAKWRAVFTVDDLRPSPTCVQVNAHALARFAALCQEQGVVPIVEPEVLMEGSHSIERSEEVTGHVLQSVFSALHDQKVTLEGMLLKPNMVISGTKCARQASIGEVALATRRCLSRQVPAAVPGIVFLSGGQNHIMATMHLSAINRLDGPKPWTLTFSYGRALQDEALEAWRGRKEAFGAGQRAFHHRARCVSAAALGRYDTSMERESAVA